MNGKPLSRDHGFPLRVIVPGFIGARSVKYLQKILIQPEESMSFFQRHDYKILPPWVNHDNVDQSWDTAASLSEMNIQCVICTPVEQEVVASSKPVTIKGYAIAGNDIFSCSRPNEKKRDDLERRVYEMSLANSDLSTCITYNRRRKGSV